MKKWIIASALCLAFSSTFAQNYQQHIQHARTALSNKDYQNAKSQFALAFKLQIDSYEDLYEAACSAALSGDKDTAFEWLQLSIDRGWFHLEHLKNDTDLQILRKDSRWWKTVKTLQVKLALQEKNYDQKLKTQLEKIYAEDQDLRRQLVAIEQKGKPDSKEVQTLWKQIDEKDVVNLKAVDAILAEHGWLGPAQVGHKASEALFLVIQHADGDARQKYVAMLRAAVKAKKARADSLALMEDRIATEAGEKQSYGSQIRRVNDQYELFPVFDPDHLDERRASMGLPPIAVYLQRWKIKWDLGAYKKQLIKHEAEQYIRPEDMQRIVDILWRGELRYLDYGKNVWVSIPSNLRIVPSKEDSHAWLWSYGYDDEPHANAKDAITISENGKQLGEEQVIARDVWPNGTLRIVTIMQGQDDNRAAQFRFTYTITADSFERKKEVKLLASEDYFVRHVYAWKR